MKRGDKAIYIGTLHYRRDEFFQIEGFQLRDDYDRALADFRKKFGKKASLRKSLARPAKS